MKSSKTYLLPSLLAFSLVGVPLINGPIVKAQNRSRKNRTHTKRKQTPAKQPTPAALPVKDEQERALDRLFHAATQLEFSWKNRFNRGAAGFDTQELSMAAEQAIAVVKTEPIRDGIGRMAKAYKDAMSLYGLAEERNKHPVVRTYSTADRERDVQEIKALKERLYKEYDDPISRDQLRAQIGAKEAIMRLTYSREGLDGVREEDPLVKRVRQRKIDARAKQVLGAYGLEDSWPENAFNVVEYVLLIGVRTSASIQACLKQPDSCSALAADAQEFSEKAARANMQSNVPASSLVGIWMLEYTLPPFTYKTPLEIEQHAGRYVGMYNGQVLESISVSENTFSFITRTMRPVEPRVRRLFPQAPDSETALTISGTVRGDQITGQYSLTERITHDRVTSYYVETRGPSTWPFTGKRLAP